MPCEFVIPDDEVAEYQDWKKEHDKVCKQKDVGAIGGRLTWSFTPTSLGTAVIIKCACGEKLDLTHSENW